jgi:hypothetical protein
MSRWCYAGVILAAVALGPLPAAAQSERPSLRFTNLEMRDSCRTGASRWAYEARGALPEASHAYDENICSTLGRGERAGNAWDARTDLPAAVDGPVDAELKGMGREGFLIARAREEVSEILRGENACSAWYREAENEPHRKFRSLRFAADESGDAKIEADYDHTGTLVIHEPYVARARQLVGPGSTITLNAHGAFFERGAPVARRMPGGGPLTLEPPRSLHVADYRGGSLRAQVTTLLHEYAHIVGLLPIDAGHPEAGLLSTHNTRVVLAHCQKEVDSSESRMIVLPEAIAALSAVKRKD